MATQTTIDDDSMDVRTVMKMWKCTEAKARQAFSVGLCAAVRVEVENGLATFSHEVLGGEHGIEWHYRITPHMARSSVSALSTADAAAIANFNILCRGDKSDPSRGVRPHVTGMALTLNGCAVDWARHIAHRDDTRVLEFPTFNNVRPLPWCWLDKDADLRLVVYLASRPPPPLSCTEHVRIIADAVYFDVAAWLPTLVRPCTLPQVPLCISADEPPRLLLVQENVPPPAHYALALASDSASASDAASDAASDEEAENEDPDDDEYIVCPGVLHEPFQCQAQVEEAAWQPVQPAEYQAVAPAPLMPSQRRSGYKQAVTDAGSWEPIAAAGETPFWWDTPHTRPPTESNDDAYAREHAEAMAALCGLSSMSIASYARLQQTRNEVRYELHARAYSCMHDLHERTTELKEHTVTTHAGHAADAPLPPAGQPRTLTAS